MCYPPSPSSARSPPDRPMYFNQGPSWAASPCWPYADSCQWPMMPRAPALYGWQDVLDVLNAGDMPPEKEPQPAAAELTAVLGALTDGLKLARRRLSDQGREITVRRLNRGEYLNTIHALFGFTLLPGLLPADDPADSFDTVGSQQFFSSYHLEQYLELGRKIVRAGFQWGNEGRRKLVVNSTEPEKGANRHLRKGLQKRMERWREVVNGLENGKTWKELGFKAGRERHFDRQYGFPF